MKLMLNALFLIGLSSCASWPSMQAKWVERDYNSQTGVLEYLDQGASSAIETRRSNAYAKMREFCGTKSYKIIREISGTKEYGGKSESEGVSVIAVSKNGDWSKVLVLNVGSKSTEVPIQMNYNYLVFNCRS